MTTSHLFRVCALGLSLAASASAAETNLPEMGWDWSEGRRYFMESSVGEVVMLFSADQNRDVVVVQFTSQVLVHCHDPERVSRKAYELRCDVERFSIQGRPRPSEAGLLLMVLEEVEAKLENGAWLQVRFRDDGQIVNFQLEGYEARFRDQNRMAENVRLILARSFAGLDLRLPLKPRERQDGIWPQTESSLAQYPSALGTAGSLEMVHVATQRANDWVVFETAARAAISPSAGNDIYDTTIESRTVFDMAGGFMVERIWMAEGWATAGSASAVGTTRPYLQAGRLFVVQSDGDVPEIMETAELTPRPIRSPNGGVDGGLDPRQQ